MNALAPTRLTKPEQDALVVANLPLVRHIASQFHGRVDFDDLVGWGYVGIVRAAADYSPERGIKFSSYAGWWIRAFMLRAIADDMGMSSNGRYRKVFFGLRRAIADLEATGADASDEAVAAKIGVDVVAVQMLRAHLIMGEVRLDARKIHDRDDEAAVDHLLLRYGLVAGDNPEAFAIAHNEHVNRVARIRIAMRGMNHREREVVQRRHLVDDPETLQEIGTDWGVSRERVRQIEVKALRKLKRGMERLK